MTEKIKIQQLKKFALTRLPKHWALRGMHFCDDDA